MNTLLIFFFAFFLVKLPPFYITPIISRVMTTHVLAKVLFLLTFVYILIKNKLIKTFLSKKINILILAYFISLSTTIFVAKDIFLFLKSYQNLLFSLIIYFLAFYIVFDGKKLFVLIKYIKFVSVICVIFEFSSILFNSTFRFIIYPIIQTDIYDYYLINLERGRYYLYTNYELFLPFFLFSFINQKKISKINNLIGFLIILFIVFLSFFSNFRRPILQILFSILFFIVIVALKKRDNLKKIITIISVVFVVAIISISISNKMFSFNIIDRFLLENEEQDYGTIQSRIDTFFYASNLAIANYSFGVGLGQYGNYINAPLLGNTKNKKNEQKIYVSAAKTPHSLISQIMAEGGLFGIGFLLLILITFLFTDFVYILSNPINNLFPFIVSFWSIFIISLFTPFDTVFMNGWFWGLRGFINGFYYKKRAIVKLL
jgi:hypothetical protein